MINRLWFILVPAALTLALVAALFALSDPHTVPPFQPFEQRP